MLGSFRKGRGNVLIWILMVMLIVGLAGWGIGVSGGLAPQSIARVGDRPISSDDYVRALQQELRAYSRQLGRELPMAEARDYGIDRVVLGRLINDAALDAEAATLGLSAGDERVRAQLMATPGFQGADGKFSRDAYTYALDNIGMKPAEFEGLLRSEVARETVAGGVQAAVRMPETAARTVLDFLGEKRGFDWIRLDAALLPAPVAAPTDAELEAEHDAHQDRYTRPETRRITTASITPDALAATIEIPEDELRAAYDADLASYQTPERRVADRIGFPDAAAAAAARARLDAGEIDFDALAAERGLTPEDIDQGFVTADELPAAARDVVFGAEGPGIVGPVDTAARAVALPHQRHPRRGDDAVRGGAARARPRPRPRRGRAAHPRGHRRTSRTCSPAAPPPRRSPPRPRSSPARWRSTRARPAASPTTRPSGPRRSRPKSASRPT